MAAVDSPGREAGNDRLAAPFFSPAWRVRTDLTARALRLIADGVVHRHGVPGLAGRLGCTDRELTTVLVAELGAGPLALAEAYRAHTARMLLDSTQLSAADVAFAVGYAGVRSLDEALSAAHPASGGLRTGVRRPGGVAAGVGRPGRVALRLPLRPPADGRAVLSFLVKRAVPGVEYGADGRYGRTLALPHAPATVWLRVDDSTVDAELQLGDLRDLGTAVCRLRRLMDLDTDPAEVDGVLAADQALAPSVLAGPGIRVPGAVDGPELVLRAVLGQQVSVAAARTVTGRLAAALGATVGTGDGELVRLFPSPAAVAERGAEVLTGPRRRIDAIRTVAAALAGGALRVHAGSDPAELSRDLQALPGIGPWTAGYVAMRVLGATDVLLSTDLMVRRGAAALGLPSDLRGLDAYSRRWRPYRSYAGMHLWRASAAAPAVPSRRPPYCDDVTFPQ